MPQHAPQLRDTTTATPTVAVELNGKNARSRSMVIDELDWFRVRLVLGERWSVARTGEREYVTGYGGKAGLMGPKGKGVTLARWLTWAERGEVVWYRDGDPLNLTRANLATVGRREFLRGFWDVEADQNAHRPTVLALSHNPVLCSSEHSPDLWKLQ